MLHYRGDFADLLVTVADRAETNAALVEKDYWVTEALRVVARDYTAGVVFKGGTSLSKAWGLIDRFSEDIDLLIRQDETTGGTGGSRDRYMKAIAQAIGEIDGLQLVTDGSRSDRGISRSSVFAYEPRTSMLEGLQPTIILEMGIRGGVHPTELRAIRSMLSMALEGTDLEDESLDPFEMIALHPRRTLVEKLFALHCACELWHEGQIAAIQRQGRHFSDVYFLLGDAEIAAYVGSEEYLALLPEVDEFGRRYFERDHRTPEAMRLASSRALSPDEELRAAIEDDYARSRFLFAGDHPSIGTIYERLAKFRERM